MHLKHSLRLIVTSTDLNEVWGGGGEGRESQCLVGFFMISISVKTCGDKAEFMSVGQNSYSWPKIYRKFLGLFTLNHLGFRYITTKGGVNIILYSA